MKRIMTVARVLLGLLFLAAGMNGFYLFFPVPDFHPFMQILSDSGYLYAVKALEVAVGLMLLANRFVPLALVLLGADLTNIALYHFLIDPRNALVVPVVALLFGILLWSYRSSFSVFLKARVRHDLD